jgi:hypothetical protein
MLRTGFEDLFFSRLPYMDTVFFENYRDFPELYTMIFDMSPSSRMREQMSQVVGLGLMQETTENEAYHADNFIAGYDKTFTHVKHTMLVEMSEEIVEDDQDSVFSQVAKAMARSVRATKETFFFNILNNGLSNIGTETTWDGNSIFNATHPYVGGGTVSNYAAADLSPANLETALTTFGDTTNHRGIPVMTQAATLWVPSALTFQADEILKTPQVPYSNENTINAVRTTPFATGLTWKWSPYITDSNSWFLIADKGTHGLKGYMRRDITLGADVDFDTGAAKRKGSMRFSGGGVDWIGSYGSSGSS